MLIIIIIIIIIIIGVRCARPGESESKDPKPQTTSPWKEEKDKIVGDKKERADHANRKALAVLLNPLVPHHQTQGH